MEIINSKNINFIAYNHLLDYIDVLYQKGYSKPTKKTYKLNLQRFLNYLKEKQLFAIDKREVRNYLIFFINEKHFSVSIQNNIINALKIFFSEYLNIEIDDYFLPRE